MFDFDALLSQISNGMYYIFWSSAMNKEILAKDNPSVEQCPISQPQGTGVILKPAHCVELSFCHAVYLQQGITP